MVKYPSSAVEQTRESIYSFQNPLEVLLLLTCLTKRGMRGDKKKLLLSECISNNNLSEEEIIRLYMLLDTRTIRGLSMDFDQRRLGYESTGQYRHEEYLVAKALETISNKRLYRSMDPSFDFECQNQKWDLIGPVAPFYFDSESFTNALYQHLDNKIGMDTLVTCTLTIPDKEQEGIRGLILEECGNRDIDVLILDSETFKNLDLSFCNF